MKILYQFLNGCSVKIKRILNPKYFSNKNHIFFRKFYPCMIAFVLKHFPHNFLHKYLEHN